MAYNYERDQLLTYPMIAFQLAKDFGTDKHIDSTARFNYQEDNIYFYEKYVNQEYENPDEKIVTWYEFSQYLDLRDDEVRFLELLQEQKVISNLIIDTVVEDDYAETGRSVERPSTYHFDTKKGYLEALEARQRDADTKIYLDANLKLTDMMNPVVTIANKSYKLRAINPDTNTGKIIEYCYNESLDKMVKLDTLKANLSLQGVTDIKTSLRGTVFYSDGALHDFADAISSRITLKSTGHILLADFKKMQIVE